MFIRHSQPPSFYATPDPCPTGSIAITGLDTLTSSPPVAINACRCWKAPEIAIPPNRDFALIEGHPLQEYCHRYRGMDGRLAVTLLRSFTTRIDPRTNPYPLFAKG